MLQMLNSSESFKKEPFLKGNSVFKQAVLHMTETGKLPHAILITGEEGIGKKTAAKYLALSVLCEKRKGEPCLVCSSCKKIISDIHPDIISLFPDASGIYKIADIRELRTSASVRPNEAEYKFYIIDKADAMNKNAANSLLKCMEEPPEGTVFVLLSDNEKALMPTVLSRSIRFRLSPLNEEYFSEYFGEKGEELFALSGGNLGKAKLLKEKSAEKPLSSLFMENAISGNTYEVLKIIKGSYKKRNEIEELLDEILVILKNALISGYSPKGKTLLEKRIAEKMTADKIFDIINETERLRELTVRNISAESILSSLFLKIKG